MKKRNVILLYSILTSLIVSPVLAQTIDGTVFRDNNANGILDAATESGVGGVTVTAFDAVGASVGSAMTIADGTYSVALSVGAGTDIRVELTGLPATLRPGPFGAGASTTVLFAQSGDSGLDVGLADPAEHCEDDPDLATSCYVVGDQTGNSGDVLLTFPYSAGNTGTSPPPGVDLPAHTPLATAAQIGPTWGLAWQRQSGSLFAGAMMKRHVAFGPGGPGAIYRIIPGGAVSLFLDLEALFPGSAGGADPHPEPISARDPVWDDVGKRGLGDLDIAGDGLTLWAVSLGDRMLNEIPIGDPPVAPASGSIIRTALPQPADCPAAATNARPFATAVEGGVVYVGLVCSAESTQVAADMRGYVYSFSGGVFTQVLNFPLNYPRTCAVDPIFPFPPGCIPAAWNPWITTFTAIVTTLIDPMTGDGEYIYPQPWLTDIEFVDGNMVIGLRDRFGDQTGFNQLSPTAPDPILYRGDSAGDVLCASPSGGGVFTIENNGSCGVLASAGGMGTGEGPGGGEFFFRDNFPIHDEISMGGLAQVPGRPDIAMTIYDPIFDVLEFFDAGALWLDASDGSRSRAYRIYSSNDTEPNTFAKGGGLGDLEALCEVAPLEIGNRVWCDANMDGVQDPGPGEAGVAGVDVVLDCGGAGSLTVTTDVNGQYLYGDADFQIANGTPIPRNANCSVSIDLASEGATIAAACLGTLPAPVDAGANDLHDSDCSDLGGGLTGVDILTGASGENNHTYDCGFFGIPADYGDAPETYGTSAGPRHDLPGTTLYLGDCVDTEGSGQPVPPGTPADGDDTGGGLMTVGACTVLDDDEDGVAFTTMIAACGMASVDVTCQGAGGQLDAWIDFNGDGDFADAGEQIFASTSLTCGGATDPLTFAVPCTAVSGQSYARFRVSPAGGTTATSTASDGEVEDYQVTVKGVDYGDAPDTYGTTQGTGGPSHVVDPGSPLYMGACVDTEADGQPVTAGTPANGDDLGAGLSDLGGCAGPDDEDGVNFDTMVVACESAQVTVTASLGGLLDAWIDFDGDGTFGAAEKIFTNQVVVGGSNPLPFIVPCSALPQAVTYARFRVSTAGGLGALGPAMDGEVEDYDIIVKGLDFGDAPTPYPTPLVDDGARHPVPPTGNPTLGPLVDTEPDGPPSADHTGDDVAGIDDEDGVVFSGDLIPGGATSISVSTGAVGGLLDAWCDWNLNGDWTDAGEQIAFSQALPDGTTTALTPMVPAGATPGTTCCRFRLSSAGGLTPTGLAMDGEVEDYGAVIAPEDPSIGLAKEVISVTEVTPGVSYSVLLKLTVENFGNVKLNNVQVTSDLAADFSEADSFAVSSVSSLDLTVDPAFIGTGNLLAGTDMLIAGAMGMIEMEVLVEPGVNLGPYSCSSQTTATSLAGTPVMDVSQAGNNGDPDGDGDPTDNDQPTAILFPGAQEIPTLGEWSLMILVLMLSTAAFHLLRRRRDQI